MYAAQYRSTLSAIALIVAIRGSQEAAFPALSARDPKSELQERLQAIGGEAPFFWATPRPIATLPGRPG